MSIPLQPTSLDIWERKYRLTNKDGVPVDETIDDTYKRVAKALSEVEETPEKKEEWNLKFLWALRHGAIPAGRIMANAGAGEYKPATSTINCTVSGTIQDSMDDILGKVHEAGLTLKAGCGIGYDFSTLRPRGAHVAGAGANTSGPLSFMDIFDKMCFTISSSGGRRGAQMATFDIRHPDVMEFIKAKREDGRLRQFNLSLLITREFITAVKDDKDWELIFPVDEGDDAKVYEVIKARDLWEAIMSSTYDYAEPGFILIDNVNDMNNNWYCEDIRTTNPCGEQPLPEYGACLLGSINLTQFVLEPFTDAAHFDWNQYREVISIFTRMLDNVVEINGLPLGKQRDEILRKRRHGMGYLGLGSALTMMGMVYGGKDSLDFTSEVTHELAIEGWKAALSLAKEKGPAPIMDEWFPVTKKMLRKRPDMITDGFSVGDFVTGRVLMMRYSEYMEKLGDSGIIEELTKVGARFTHHTSIAPTGTIALSLGNNVSNGIEPSFSHKYSRNVIVEGKKTKEKVNVYSYELLAYWAMSASQCEIEDLPDSFVQASDITPKQHVDIQAAAQYWVDSSISKTINVPTDIPYEDFKDVYMYAAEKGLKGCTTFRFNPDAFQGVLVKEEDLENTTYQFDLEDGSHVRLKGNEEVSYDNEIHTAANLHDALKEGYYGKL